MRLTITGYGFKEAEVGFSRILALTSNVSSAWPAVIRELRSQQAQQFTTQGASGASGKWLPLSAQYKIAKQKKYPGRTILERTGRLRASLQVETGDSAIEKHPMSLFFGTTVPYAQYHQDGPRRRPIFSLTNRQLASIGSTMHKWLGAEVSKAMRSAA